MSHHVKVDIWSDIACPWCFVGKRRLETAAAELLADGAELRVDDPAELAAEIGLDRDEAVEALRASTHRAAVLADKDQAVEYGIAGVPFFVIDGRVGVSGAQDPSVLADVLREAAGLTGATA